jgi:hypothetical protein
MKYSKFKTKLSQMHPVDIKRLFEKSLKNGLLYGTRKDYEKAITIYMLSDESLKKELDDIAMELQNKKIDIHETIMDSFEMVSQGLIAQLMKEKKEKENGK